MSCVYVVTVKAMVPREMLSRLTLVHQVIIISISAHVSIPGYLTSGLSWFSCRVSFALEFQCCYFCESSSLFYLSFNYSDFYVSKKMHL